MKLHIDRLSEGLETCANLPALKRACTRFEAGRVTGFATLTQTSFLKQFRLMFFGTGDFSETMLCGPTFDAHLLEVPALGLELREVVDEFFKQVRQLDSSEEAPQNQKDVSARIVEHSYTQRRAV